MHTVLILGGYGFFGARIARALARDGSIHLLLGGRDAGKAQALARELDLPAMQGIGLDCHAPGLADWLQQHKVNTVIHTAGPFQGQDYAVACSAIEAGANYIDLADGRDFVAGITQLDARARERGVFVTSGASSLPALSSAVVDRYAGRFSRLDAIRMGIGSGARAPGLATMKGVFSYCGKPFARREQGAWATRHGWLDMLRYRFPAPVGSRLLGSCDVPDLALFPERYRGVQTVSFHAGFAGALGHLFIWLMAQLVRVRLLPSLLPLVEPLHKVSQWLEPVFSDKGGMFVVLEGLGSDGAALKLAWHVIAARNHGPNIPCGASIALARKLAGGETLPAGAMPCMGLLTTDEYLSALSEFDIMEIPA